MKVGTKLLSRKTNSSRKQVAQTPAAMVKRPFVNESQEGPLHNGLLPGNRQLEEYRFLMKMANIY